MRLLGLGVHRWFDQATGLTTILYRLMSAVIRTFQDSRFVLHTIGKARRLGLVHFRKEYVRSQLAARKGDCLQCGTCCSLLFTCPMLTRPGKCLVYGFCRPQACKVFPIDQRDIEEVTLCGGHCGYRW
jgi:hypothetical protein